MKKEKGLVRGKAEGPVRILSGTGVQRDQVVRTFQAINELLKGRDSVEIEVESGSAASIFGVCAQKIPLIPSDDLMLSPLNLPTRPFNRR